MEDNKREYDAVLGGQAAPPVNGVVLGGIEGVRRRLGNADVNVRVEAVLDALTYKKAGLNLVMQALQTDEAIVEAALHEYILSIYAKQKYVSWLHVEQKDYLSLEELLELEDWQYANSLTKCIINKIIDGEKKFVQPKQR
ncbi:leucine rich repeat variant [Calothrix sp. NIES-4071]|nr:leucine rich repeat variant [Calothrix sp. NIES-4071]BAZ61436.1 leucine rich repeat variant [Calothrix sp. NIES-4105]